MDPILVGLLLNLVLMIVVGVAASRYTSSTLNIVGMRRMKISSEEIDAARWSFRMLMRRGLQKREALEVLRERAERPMVAEYIAFVESSDRPLVRGVVRRTDMSPVTAD